MRRLCTAVRTLFATLLLLLALPSLALATEGDLQLVSITGDSVTGNASSGYTVYIRDGGSMSVDLNVRNATAEEIDYIGVTQAPTYGEGDEVWGPIEFPHPYYGSITPPVENAEYDSYRWYTSDTSGNSYTYSTYGGFDIEAGVTATFTLNISAGDLAAGTYNWNLQLGRTRHDYENRIIVVDPTLSYWDTFDLGTEVEETFITVPIRVVVYAQANASIQAGVNTGTGYEPEIDAGPIDFGTIDLATADESVLQGSRTIYVLNNRTAHSTDKVANVTDAHGNPVTVTVSFDGEWFVNGEYNNRLNTPFAFGSSSGGLSWEPLEPRTDTTFSYAEAGVSFDATYYIAGTYTGSLFVCTTPHTLLINGQMSDGTGVYRIPFTVTLTGTNPRLLPRVTDLVATPGNGQVELTWTPAEGYSTYTEYTIYRRVGAETQSVPDKIDWGLYEKVGTKSVGDNEELLYLDADVENGITYSYVVICGEPCRGYVSAAASATPDASIQSRMLAPVSSANASLYCVEVEWHMNDKYGGWESDGAGMVDHFNIYRDGVLVDQIYRSAVYDEVQLGWHDDGTGTGTQIYGPKSHNYSWTVEEPVPELYVTYNWTVSAVSLSGLESFLDEECPAFAYGEVPVIEGHTAYFNNRYYDYSHTYFDDMYEGPAMMIVLDAYAGINSPDEYKVWRAEGTDAPDTSQPVCSTIGFDGSHLCDRGVVAGRTYTYTAQPISNSETTGESTKGDYYTFTVKAITPPSNIYYHFDSPDVEWKILNGTTASLEFGAPKYTTATVYRNSTKIDHEPGDGYDTWYFEVLDDPGADGTYVYRVEYTCEGITTSREFTFVRNTQPVDTSGLLQPPGAPTLTGRTAGQSNIILTWTPASTGGTPEGYHIYRTDANRQIAGGRYLIAHRWNGDYEYFEQWGSARYISLAGGDTLTFVDGRVDTGTYYKGDKYLGEITGLGWDDTNMPHTYYITAYNRAGESAPSELVVFAESVENQYGSQVAPPNPADEAPDAPIIKEAWIDWEDSSSYRNGFDDWITGNIHVAWEDTGLGADIDSWTATFAGLHWEDNGNPPRTDSLDYHKALLDPNSKLGTTNDAPTYQIYGYVRSGDLGRTITVTVSAENVAGSSTSEPLYVDVNSTPRFYAMPDNGGALLRWTDLADDTTTQVTSWEIWRRPAYGLWERVDVLPGTTEYAGVGKTYNNQQVSYYEWSEHGLENGWAYEYKVVAKCADGIDRPSVVREITPKSTAAVEGPGAPRNLTATVANGIVYLNWDEPATGGAVSTYSPRVKGGSYSWNSGPISSVPGTTTSAMWTPNSPGTYKILVWAYANIEGLTVPDSKYPYQVDGFDDMTDEEQAAALYPNPSNIITVTVTQEDIDSRPSGDAGDFTLTLTPGEGQITLTWTASENAISYVIDRINNAYPDIPNVTIATVSGQQVYTWVDTSAEPGVRYRYTVSTRASGRQLYRDGYAAAYGMTYDEEVAARVEALINALPNPEDVTLDDATLIMDVQEVWETLTPKQQSLVDTALAQKLADDVTALEDLALLEQYAELVAPVQAMIDALPDFDDVTEGDRAAVEAARAAYDALNPAEAKRLVKTARLVDAEEALATLADRAAAATVAAQIEALPGADTLALADATAVEAARAAYDALGASAKEYVPASLVSKLEADEARITELVQQAADAEAAAPVIAALEALPPAANLTLADEGAVTAARTAYDALTASQKALVAEALVSNLEACEAKIPELRKAAEDEAAAAPVIAAIDALPGVDDLTLDDAGAVANAAAAYQALTEDQQALVGEERALKLDGCVARVAELVSEAGVADVERLIDAIGEVTLDKAGAIATARAAYDALADDEKAQVSNVDTLVSAEAALQALRDAAAAAEVEGMIGDLPAPGDVTPDDEAAIAAARAAYDALSDGAKALVGNYDDLAAAEEALAALAPIPMHRLYNRWSGEHFYTADAGERDHLVSVGWTYEGIGWNAPTSGVQVYRLYNRWVSGGDHHYTMDRSEYDFLVSVGWSGEGPCWFSDANKTVPVYREYNPWEFAHNHNYTADPAEHRMLLEVGWNDEGIGWYGV